MVDVDVEVVKPISYTGAYFDGVDDKITLPNSLFGTLTSISNFTICGSFLYKAGLGDSTILNFTKGSGLSANNVGIWIFISEVTGFRIGFGSGTGREYITLMADTSSLKNNWTNFAISFNNNEIILYINGSYVLTDNISFSNVSINDISSSLIGCTGAGGSSYFSKMIKNLCIYNTTLNYNEMINASSGTYTDNGLIHRWKLCCDYNDSVGTAHGTNSGTIFTAANDSIKTSLEAMEEGVLNKLSGSFCMTTLNGKLFLAGASE